MNCCAFTELFRVKQYASTSARVGGIKRELFEEGTSQEVPLLFTLSFTLSLALAFTFTFTLRLLFGFAWVMLRLFSVMSGLFSVIVWFFWVSFGLFLVSVLLGLPPLFPFSIALFLLFCA